MNKKNILVTGANGQLGSELKVLAANTNFHFIFTDVEELDLTNASAVNAFFEKQNIDYCINCAAYTAVDKAEANEAVARLINVEAVRHLAQACKLHHAILVHISTDFVFAGDTTAPLIETDTPEPLSIYGQTKLDGEQAALQNNPRTLVLRTAWLYSSFGNNFVKTMIRLGQERDELQIVSDQVGTPTYAADLAGAILSIIFSDKLVSEGAYGIYHFSNLGLASWYDFAMSIFEMKGIHVRVLPILTQDYPTPARRPAYSVLDKSKIQETFGLQIPYWRDSLRRCIQLFG